jgi:hypothetical protein
MDKHDSSFVLKNGCKVRRRPRGLEIYPSYMGYFQNRTGQKPNEAVAMQKRKLAMQIAFDTG